MDGIIIINKEKGISSFGVVSKVRRIFNTKKVGHCGTLDPNAIGVLPIMIGNATKISKYLVEHDKEYTAVLKFGVMTDTADAEGKILKEDAFKLLESDKEKYVELLKSFVGKCEQTPPMYSAIKVNGKKLYEYAREGQEIKREKRKIEIYSLCADFFDFENNEMTFSVKCSKGTYIRSLCEDIATKFGTVGYMKELTRKAVDSFSIEQSVTLSELEASDDRKKYVIPLEILFENAPSIVLDDKRKRMFLNGVKLSVSIIDGVCRVYCGDEFLGLGVVEKSLLKRDVIVCG